MTIPGNFLQNWRNCNWTRNQNAEVSKEKWNSHKQLMKESADRANLWASIRGRIESITPSEKNKDSN